MFALASVVFGLIAGAVGGFVLKGRISASKLASIETVLNGYEVAASAEIHTLIADVRSKL
jgi:hypothetical protein